MARQHHTVPREDRAEGWDPKAYSDARIRAGMTWQRLVEALRNAGVEVSMSTVHRYSTPGQSPPAWLVSPLARALKVRKRDLLV